MTNFDMRLINNPNNSRDVAISTCYKCGEESRRILSEHKRACNRQSKYTDHYHCKSCLRKLSSFNIDRKYVTDKWKKQCSERSSNYWKQLSKKEKENKTQKMKDSLQSDKVRLKISESIKEKFNDASYVNKIKEARKKYWENDDYRNSRILSMDTFLERSKQIHGDKYDYSHVKFDAAKDGFVDIICKDHGIFKQRVLWHCNYGYGCPNCSSEVSKPHKEIIDFIHKRCTNNNITYKINDRSAIGLEYDIYFPDRNFAIEYNGNWYHSHDNIESENKNMHYIKSLVSYRSGIRLLQITEDDWLKKEIVKSMIFNGLNLSYRLYARGFKCDVLEPDQEREFFDKSHLYGYKPSTLAIGLFLNNNCFMAMSFTKYNTYWEIARLATHPGYVIVGGASKLFKCFLRFNEPNLVISYADRMLSNGDVYKHLGFKFDYVTKPGYKYFKNGKTFPRQQFQKHKLKDVLELYDDNLTEYENMFNNGYRIIWNAGHNKYKWENNY